VDQTPPGPSWTGAATLGEVPSPHKVHTSQISSQRKHNFSTVNPRWPGCTISFSVTSCKQHQQQDQQLDQRETKTKSNDVNTATFES
jgi:hypothetical protein